MEKKRLSFLIGALILLALIVISSSSAQTDTETVTIYNIPEESGNVCNDRSLGSDIIVGSDGRIKSQALLSFDVSSIPKGSTIKEVAIDLRNNEITGNSFKNVGCLKIYPVSYEEINWRCYSTGSSNKYFIKKCSNEDLSEPIKDHRLKNILKENIGKSRFQLRMQFDEARTFNPFSHNTESSNKPPCIDWSTYSGGGLEESSFAYMGDSDEYDEIYFDDVSLIITFTPPSGNAP